MRGLVQSSEDEKSKVKRSADAWRECSEVQFTGDVGRVGRPGASLLHFLLFLSFPDQCCEGDAASATPLLATPLNTSTLLYSSLL